MNNYARVYRKFLMPTIERQQGCVTGLDLQRLMKNQSNPLPSITDFQIQRIKLLIKNAYENTIFYRKRFDKVGLRPEDVETLDDLRNIPPLTREDLNENLYTLIAMNIKEKDRHFASTGGSTGLATRFARDNACMAIKKAAELRFNTWAEWVPGDKILYYWPALADFSGSPGRLWRLRSKLYLRSMSLYAGRLNPAILSEHIDNYNWFKPDLVRAFPSALQRFAEFLAEKHIQPPPPKAIICVGEPLLDSQKELFRSVFQTEIFNCYVSRECGNLACECSEHRGLHVAEDMIYMEIIKKEGEYGDILLTDLWNFGMPFIRYRIQDTARWEIDSHTCRISFRSIGVDAARVSDFLISPVDGSFVSGSTLIHYLLAENPQVGRVKLIQTSLNRMTVMMIGSQENNTKGISHIQSRIDVIFGGKMKADFDFVDSIELLPSGKYRFVERQF